VNFGDCGDSRGAYMFFQRLIHDYHSLCSSQNTHSFYMLQFQISFPALAIYALAYLSFLIRSFTARPNANASAR
jgi:hypothetical protein